jgi:hypothetical protein
MSKCEFRPFSIFPAHTNGNSGASLDSLSGFVHLSEAGKDTYIYVIDRGVQVDARNKVCLLQRYPKAFSLVIGLLV